MTGAKIAWGGDLVALPLLDHLTLSGNIVNDRSSMVMKTRNESRRLSNSYPDELKHTKSKNTICLWFDNDAHEAARFYAATFPDSKVTAVHEAPADYPPEAFTGCD
jgi:3-demethylubiquinone-9 3-methyltransferase